MKLSENGGMQKHRKKKLDLFDEKINRELRWREIEKHLSAGINTILDVGGATGAFSIPLAERGFKVVHFDLADEMIAIAKRKAEEKRLKNITFE